jgi:3-hydroxyacyl-CoA dehydrogenase
MIRRRGLGSVSTLSIDDGIGIIRIDSPPVNALGAKVRIALAEGLAQFTENDTVSAIVIICGGRTFFAGADISEFGKPLEGPGLTELCSLIDSSQKPIIAAIHGTALGGGLEMALACHYRVALSTAKFGLPEVHLGLLPGAGGTQRLPRIVGVDAALDLITSGRTIAAPEALALGIADRLADEGRLQDEALDLARSVIGDPLIRVRDRQEKIDDARLRPEIFTEFRRKNARAFRGFKAPENIVRAIEAAVELPFDKGLERERQLFKELEASIESQAQRAYFFAQREAAKLFDIPADTPTIPIKSVAVIGAGTMGGGITMNFLNAGIPVTLVELDQEALDRGRATIRRNYEKAAKKARMTSDQVEICMSLITPAVTLDALSNADLVIEAVFEEMAIKKDLFSKLDRIVKPGAILASNTSFLDLDEIAAATSRPGSVIGLHFFSPANVMRLLEVVRGEKTANAVIATAMALAKRIGKVPVLSRVCHGFIANSIMSKRAEQADALALEGTTPTEIDQALYDFGFAMGHFAMMDLVGLDVIGRGSTKRSVAGDLVAMGRLGQKQNGGYYDYDESRKATPSPAAAAVIADIAAYRGIAKKSARSPDEIVARLLYPVVNEGAKLLEKGIALRASDIDVAAILGYNWPIYSGGPMFWADTVGLPKIVETLRALEAEHGEAFRPAGLLEKKAADGERFTHG